MKQTKKLTDPSMILFSQLERNKGWSTIVIVHYCHNPTNSAHADGGPRSPGSAHARPSAHPPIDVSENFPAHVSAESLF